MCQYVMMRRMEYYNLFFLFGRDDPISLSFGEAALPKQSLSMHVGYNDSGQREEITKRPRVNLWVKQRLEMELLEIPYCGRDLRVAAQGCDSNYLDQYIRRKPDRRREELIRQSRKKIQQEKPFTNPQQLKEPSVSKRSALEEFLVTNVRIQVETTKKPQEEEQVKQSEQPKNGAIVTRVESVITPQEKHCEAKKVFPKSEAFKQPDLVESEVVMTEQHPMVSKPSGSIRKLIDLTQYKKKDGKKKRVPAAQHRLSYNTLFGAINHNHLISEQSNESSSPQKHHPLSQQNNYSEIADKQEEQIDEHHSEENILPQESRKSSEKDEYQSRDNGLQYIPEGQVHRTPSELERERRIKATVVNEELRDILGRKREDHTPSDHQINPSDQLQDGGLNRNPTSLMQNEPVNRESPPKLAQLPRIDIADEDEQEEAQKSDIGSDGKEKSVVAGWSSFSDYEDSQKSALIDFNELPDYHSEEEQNEPDTSPTESAPIEAKPNALDEFENYDSSSECERPSPQRLDEVKQENSLYAESDQELHQPVPSFVKIKPNGELSKQEQNGPTIQQNTQPQPEQTVEPPELRSKKQISKQSVHEEKPLTKSFVNTIGENRLSEINEPMEKEQSFQQEEKLIDLEHMMVGDTRQNVDKLYERMSSAFQPDAEPRKNADQVFEELNQDLNMSELRKDIDRLKDRIATDHSGFL